MYAKLLCGYLLLTDIVKPLAVVYLTSDICWMLWADKSAYGSQRDRFRLKMKMMKLQYFWFFFVYLMTSESFDVFCGKPFEMWMILTLIFKMDQGQTKIR